MNRMTVKESKIIACMFQDMRDTVLRNILSDMVQEMFYKMNLKRRSNLRSQVFQLFRPLHKKSFMIPLGEVEEKIEYIYEFFRYSSEVLQGQEEYILDQIDFLKTEWILLQSDCNNVFRFCDIQECMKYSLMDVHLQAEEMKHRLGSKNKKINTKILVLIENIDFIQNTLCELYNRKENTIETFSASLALAG